MATMRGRSMRPITTVHFLGHDEDSVVCKTAFETARHRLQVAREHLAKQEPAVLVLELVNGHQAVFLPENIWLEERP